MSTVGIVAEFNPLHNGHQALISYAKKELKADNVVIVMSGNFTQRGDCAIIDKYHRARFAIHSGADIVFELPVTAATATAELFARGAIGLINQLHADILLFGCEDDDIDRFYEAAASEPRRTAFSSKPNNILGIEYIRALIASKSKTKPICLKRKGSSHNDTGISDKMASSQAIRGLLSENRTDKAASLMPEFVYDTLKSAGKHNELLYPDDLSLLLHHRLISHNDFSCYLDCNSDLSDKINKHKAKFVSKSDFVMQLKSKDVKYSRLSRMLLHIILDIQKSDIECLAAENYAPYLHILDFSKEKAGLLSSVKRNITLPLFASVNEAKSVLNDNQMHLLKKDVFADDIYRIIMTSKSGHIYPNAYTKNFHK